MTDQVPGSDPHQPEKGSAGEDARRNAGKLYGQLPPGSSMLPLWLQITWVWVMFTMGGAIVTWALFRAFSSATRGNMTAATTSLIVGLVTGVIASVIAYRARRGKP